MELKEISKEELKRKLELHRKWLNDEEGGVKLDLRNTNLRHTDLEGANLKYADLSYTDLSCANLKYVNLIHADLKGVDLEDTDLSYADLRYSYLGYADLSYADLRCADLRYADLNNSDLTNSDLRYANLINANLSKTKFYLTNLYKAKGNFIGVENIGSKNDTTYYFYNEDRIICDYFDGTMKEFEDKIKEIYKENDKEYKQYMIVIDTLKRLAELEGEE